MFSRLNINGVDVALSDVIPVSTNFAVADVRNPESRDASYSKSVNIPGTAEVNILFEQYFDVNVVLQTFNPNLKLPVSYFVNEIKVFSGALQLTSITSNYMGSKFSHFYNCKIVGEAGNIFIDIANKFLEDINFSDLDHTLSINASPLTDAKFNPTLGVGYCYPFIDYGLDGGNGFNWYFSHLKPAIFELEYFKRIFANAGYTFTSTHLNSTYYKSIIIPCVDEGTVKLSNASIINSQFYAGRTAPTTANVAGSYATSVNQWVYGNSSVYYVQPVQINDDSSAPFSDPGGIYNTGTFIFTVPISGYYTIVYNASNTFNFNLPATGVTIEGSQALGFFIEKSTDGGATWNVAAANWFTVQSAVPASPSFSVTVTIQLPGNYYTSGTQFRCSIKKNGLGGWTIRNGGGAAITTGTSSLDVVTNVGTSFYDVMTQTNTVYGNPVDMNSTVPKKIKQIDFITSIIKAENLYIEIDKANPKNYIIEPRETFIQYTNPLNWTNKQDLSNEITTVPMGDLDFKRLNYTHKADKDFLNESYTNEFGEVYGNKRVDIVNDFIKTEKTVELIFSPTPGAAIQTNIVAPRLYKLDSNGNPVTTQFNIRRLYWGGLKSCNTYNFDRNGVFIPLTQYPYAGHLDDPYLPTIDINFDNPKKVYYPASPTQVLTTNTLYGRGYSTFITEITDPNSKIVKSKFFLNENDISSFSFRNIVFVDNANYFVNKIENYDPNTKSVCDVELLKLKKGAVFLPFNYPPGNPPVGGNTNFIRFEHPQFNNNSNYNNNRSTAFGFNAVAYGNGNFVQGSNVYTGENLNDVQVLGYSGGVDLRMSGKFGVRNGALTVGDDGVNSMKIARDHEYTADFIMTSEKTLYLVDASSGNRIITLPDEALENQKYTLVRVDDSAFSVTVQGFSGSELIQSTGISATTDVVPGYTTRNYLTNYAKWYY